jgi:hypothetical protein
LLQLSFLGHAACFSQVSFLRQASPFEQAFSHLVQAAVSHAFPASFSHVFNSQDFAAAGQAALLVAWALLMAHTALLDGSEQTFLPLPVDPIRTAVIHKATAMTEKTRNRFISDSPLAVERIPAIHTLRS